MLLSLPFINNPTLFFWVMLINMLCYMPTLSLSITIAYSALKNHNEDVVKVYPPIRTVGTIGFIIALWTISITHNEQSANQFYVASAAAFALGILAFWLPKCPPLFDKSKERSLVDVLGLKAFTLFNASRSGITTY